VLTPGKNYLGVETMKHLKGYGSRPILILSSKEEAPNGAEDIAKVLGDTAELDLLDQTRIHGTRMFGQVPQIEARITKWVADLLSAEILLDGTVTREEAAGGNFGEWDMIEEGVAKVTLRTAGRGIYAALRVTPAMTASDRFILAWAPKGEARGAHRIVYRFGQRGRVSLEALVSGRWKEVEGALPEDYRLGVGTGEVVEVLVPRTLPGLREDGNLKVAFGFARRPKVAIAVLPPTDPGMTKVESWLEFGL
jgi:hypothetical protein